MDKGINLERVVFLDENRSNPLCHVCKKELSGFLITEEELISYFSPKNLGWLFKKKYILQTKRYAPKLIVYLCRKCSKAKEK